MNRFHVHLNVADLGASIRFYSELFAAPPTVRTVADLCTAGNPITRGICESRECARREHADEPLCQRLQAAEERRRQPQ